MKKIQLVKHKIFTWNNISDQLKEWRSEADKIVFTNGVFDLIHTGHIDYLAKAADCANRLVVGLNGDESVKRLNKGPARPIKDQDTRAIILASLQFVDAVILFDEDTPYELIKLVQPDVLVKGGDYDPNEMDPSSKKYIVGSDLVIANGGEVKSIEFVPGHSTSRLEEKIIQANLR